MDAETRTLRQVTIDDAAAADEIFTILMGEDVESAEDSSSETRRRPVPRHLIARSDDL